MHILVGFALLVPLFARPPKPTCDQKSRGRFWPEEANSDRQQMFKLSRAGHLEICIGHGKKKSETFQWEVVGIHVSQLPKEPPSEQREEHE